MPILKQLVSSSSQSKRRSRADLTAEMISAPLGDFRHTMHVGRGGDTFGDTSFLSSRSGEPPRQAADAHHHSLSSLPPTAYQEAPPDSPTHKPSLLSRTFRSSKRSQSVNRPDKHKAASTILTVSGGVPGSGSSSPSHVKSAISLPYLNDAGGSNGNGGGYLPKSVSSSPIKKLPEGADNDVLDSRRPANGGTVLFGKGSPIALATQEPDLLDLERERRFGELRDLPPSLPRGGGGMKHAESIMSFHIDLGPSMLGDILSVMDKRAWGGEDDDLGYEEGRPSPPRSPPEECHLEPDNSQNDTPSPPAPSRPPRSTTANHAARFAAAGVDLRSKQQQQLDSCSMSSSGSTVQEDRISVSSGLRGQHAYNSQPTQPQHYNHKPSETDADSARFSSPGRTRDDEQDFSFMDDDEDEDEIRV